jgi:hypothetical protein
MTAVRLEKTFGIALSGSSWKGEKVMNNLMKYVLRAGLAMVLLASPAAAQSNESIQDGGKPAVVLFSATPLMDLGTETYKGFEGGLYTGGSDVISAIHAADGSRFASQIQPLDADGNPDPDGKIGFTSLGMSNAYDEFMDFIPTAKENKNVNSKTLVLVNGALPNATACYWTVAEGTPPCPVSLENEYDRVRDTVLTPAGLTEKQVQVVWIKDANPNPGLNGACGTKPCSALCNPTTVGCVNAANTTEAIRYEQQLGEILRAAAVRWPNLKLAFIASRIYAGYATVTLNPEPYAYEYGFSSKWLIQAQITQMQTSVVDPIAGNLDYNTHTAPWVAWGVYIWADGPIPRSDGLIWCDGAKTAPCLGEVDFQAIDGTHPNMTGANKVVNILMTFFLNSPYTESWFDAAP